IKGLCIFGIIGLLLASSLALAEEESTTIESSTTLDEDSSTIESTQEEPTTTLPPPVLCDDGELFLPAKDCRQYYQCLYGIGILKLCPDGLYWDNELSVCAWDSQKCVDDGDKTTESPGLTCASGATFLPYPPDCSKFIQCVYNIGIKQNCPPGLYWNQPLQACDYTCNNGDE
ncbi:hypothetical protein KR009_009198, partial [Drosophila setifemur]